MGFKLLLADDSITIQKVVGIIFSSEEYELTIVNNGAGALEKAAEVVPDVMLVDTLMPGASGYEVCEKIRQDQALRNIPILLLTGAFEPFNVEKARESGADDFISKPFESQVLIEKVQGLIALGKERKTSPIPVVEPAASAPSPLPPEETIWASEMPQMQAPMSPPAAAAFSTVPEPDNLWEMDFQVDAAEKPLRSEQPASEQWVPAPEEQLEDVVWQPGADAAQGTGESAGTDDFSSEPVALENFRAEGVIEVSPDDDLWGAFELEPVEEGSVDPIDIMETYTVDAGETLAEEDAFASEAPPVASWKIPAASGSGPEPVETGEDFFFGQNSFEPVPPSIPEVEVPPASAVAAFEPELSEPAPTPDAETFPLDTEAAGEGNYFFSDTSSEESEAAAAEPAGEAGDKGAEVITPSVAEGPKVPVTGGESLPVTIDEQQLAAVIAKVSREIIEKVVWEVVPDLAEILIKEEIRKIKEGR